MLDLVSALPTFGAPALLGGASSTVPGNGHPVVTLSTRGARDTLSR